MRGRKRESTAVSCKFLDEDCSRRFRCRSFCKSMAPHAAERNRAAPAPVQEAGVPSVDSTPEQLNLLELEPKGLKRPSCESTELLDPPAIIGRILGICESSAAICVHTVLLVLALAYAHASGAAAIGLSVLTLSHPALLYPVVQWYKWNREVAYAWHGANLAQRRSPSRVGARQPRQRVHPAMPALDRRRYGQMVPSKGSVTNAFERQRAQMPPSKGSVANATPWRHCPSTRSPPTARGHESSPLGHRVHSAVPAC